MQLLNTDGDKNHKGDECDPHKPEDLSNDACNKEIRFNLGVPNNITSYWNFTSRTINGHGDIKFETGEALNADESVTNPVSIPFTGLWTVSNIKY